MDRHTHVQDSLGLLSGGTAVGNSPRHKMLSKSGKSKPLEAEEEGAEEQLATSGGVLDLLFKGIFI